jgi:hypothetical protein
MAKATKANMQESARVCLTPRHNGGAFFWALRAARAAVAEILGLPAPGISASVGPALALNAQCT